MISPADMRSGEVNRVLLAEEIQHGLDRTTREASRAARKGMSNERFHAEVFERVVENSKKGVFDFLTPEDIASIEDVIISLKGL